MSNAVFSAKVKNVLSGDTLILTPPKFKGTIAPERLLTLAYVRAPALQTNDVYSAEAKEFVRTLLIGKEIKFRVLNKNPAGKEFGDVQAPIFKSLIEHLIEHGIVRLRDNLVAKTETEEDYIFALEALEEKAKAKNVGLWGNNLSKTEYIDLTKDLVEKSQKTPISTIIEKVISGDRVQARVLINKTTQITTAILLAGVRAPRTASPADAIEEPFSKEAKDLVEKAILGKKIKVTFVGESQTGVPIGRVLTEADENVSLLVLQAGLGEVQDYHSEFVGSEIMSTLRTAERNSKLAGSGKWKSLVPVAAPVLSKTSGPNVRVAAGQTLDAIIGKVVSPDTLSIRLKNDKEHTVQLASLKGPRQSDGKTAPFINQAREFVRKTSIGKQVKVYVDAIRPKSDNFDERPLVTVTLANGEDLSELIVKNGYAGVVRHNKQTSDERSTNWDKLVELEKFAQDNKKGIFNPKIPPPERIVDASENASRANTFFSGFVKKGKMTGIVEYVVNVNRYIISLPKESTKLVLILGGLANSNSKEFAKFNEEGTSFVNKKILQREVQFEVTGKDKIGSFIGNLFVIGQKLPLQTVLLSNGYVKIHDGSLSSSGFANDFEAAETDAQSSKKGIWASYVPEDAAVAEVSKQVEQLKVSPTKFFNIEVTDVSDTGVISFKTIGADSQAFKNFMTKFHQFNSLPAASSNVASGELGTSPVNLTKAPSKNEYVSIKDSDSGKYYRGKVLSFDRASNKYEVKHIDYGNVDRVPLRDLRTLPRTFSVQEMPIQAHTSKLKNIRLPPSQPTDFLSPALDYLDDVTYNKQLACAATVVSNGEVEYEVELFEAEKIKSGYSINKELLEQGLAVATVNDKDLKDLEAKAKRSHLGCWKYGEVDFDE